LKDILDGQPLLETRADDFFERGFEVAADDKNEFPKSAAQGVVDGVINDGFARRSDGINLFQTAVAAAHASSEDE